MSECLLTIEPSDSIRRIPKLSGSLRGKRIGVGASELEAVPETGLGRLATVMRYEIGDMLMENQCRVAITGSVVEEFVSLSGDPHLWGRRPNLHLLREIIMETGMDLGEFDVEDVTACIWSIFISPLLHYLCHQWDELEGICGQCGEGLRVVFGMMGGAETGYSEECPRCRTDSREHLHRQIGDLVFT